MKLKSKKTGKVITVSESRWRRIKEHGRQGLYETVGAKPKVEKVTIENLSKPKPKVEPKAEEPEKPNA